MRANHFAHSFCTEILMIYLWSLVTCCNRELYLKIQKKPKVCNLFHLIWVLKSSLDYFWMITLEYYWTAGNRDGDEGNVGVFYVHYENMCWYFCWYNFSYWIADAIFGVSCLLWIGLHLLILLVALRIVSLPVPWRPETQLHFLGFISVWE